jgi:transcriptional regulator with XRE-family HTH domain
MNRLTSQEMGWLIGERLIAAGISQAEFCRRVGVTPKHLCKVIGGTAVATSAQLDYWAFALGCGWSVSLTPLKEEQ